jgi:hypothetical protein
MEHKEDVMKRIQNWTTIGVLMLLMAGALAYIGWVAPAPSSADASWPEPGPPGPQPTIPGFEVDQIVTELQVD